MALHQTKNDIKTALELGEGQSIRLIFLKIMSCLLLYRLCET